MDFHYAPKLRQNQSAHYNHRYPNRVEQFHGLGVHLHAGFAILYLKLRVITINIK